MGEIAEQVEKVTSELRRGIVVLAVLSQLDEPQYGYSLMRVLADRGLEIEEGTLYPLLRRLEKRKLLQSEWQVGESRPRRYYKISPLGVDVLTKLVQEWGDMVSVMDGLLN
jgi:DNA-binding PadR family transcriptional regulator